ncbi:MAG TPA: thiamine phosphate synthase [Polyangiaceae bacterium]
MEIRGLYPIVDVETLRARGLPIVEFADAVLAARPRLLQLRAKASGARETLELLRALKPRCAAAGALLFANDRPDLAVLAGADGVHVGQGDLSLSDVRAFAPQLAVGVSTHGVDELEAALAGRPAYVAFGPVFGTLSKRNPEPTVGSVGLAEAGARARRAGVPLVAIGGIDLERAPSVAEHAAAAAVIGALVPPAGAGMFEAARERALALQAALGAG